MKFLPPEGQSYTVSDTPANNNHPPMAFSEIETVAGDFGTIVSEKFIGEEFQVWQHYFSIQRPTFIYVLSRQPILTISYMIEGNPIAKIPGLDEIPLRQNTAQLFYVPCIKQPVWFEAGTYYCTRIVFPHHDLQKFTSRCTSLKMLYDYALHKSERVLPHEAAPIDDIELNFLDELNRGANDDIATSYLVRKTTVLHLLLLYMNKHHPALMAESGTNTDRGRIEAVKQYIDNHLHQKIELEELATRFGLSVNTLLRHFAARYKKSPYNYFLEKRLLHGITLMHKEGLNVAEASDRLGYCDSASYIHTFTEHFGCSPRQYLRKHYRHN